MSRLRIALPPLDQLDVESQVQFVRLDRAGRVTDEGRSSLAQLGQTHKKAVAAECFLHPRDSQLASLELPQLPAAKVAAAVACAAQALILGPIEQMHVAHGPRETSGLVQVGWLPLAGLEQLHRVLTQAQLNVHGLYPAPYALPVPAAGQLSVALVDEQLLLRHSLQQGAVHPLGPQALDELQRSGADLHQVAEGATQLSGTPPTWGLHGRLKAADAGAAGWGRALAFSALALAVWTLGLNLYAARQVDEGQRLKAQMSQQVKQAFPELSIILNPLQQARQQLAARQNGAAGDPGQRFTSLLQLAGSNMPFMVGSVETLVFEQGRLHLSLLADSRSPAVEGDWQATLAEAGFSATRDDQGWTLMPANEQLDADESAADDEDDDE